jgi:putative DNA primase/helicase
MRLDWGEHIGAIARRVLGEPNRALSTAEQLRFGTHGSIAVEIGGEKRGTWYDHEHQVGGGVLDLLRIRLGLVNGAALDWLRTEIGIEAGAAAGYRRRIVATYDYEDEGGALLFQVARIEPKDFRQRRPDGNGGWTWKVKGVRQVPYRLPELIAGRGGLVLIPEGEKDCNALARWGLVATCNAGGAGKWRREFAAYFAGADIVVLPDNDEAGRSHARDIVSAVSPTARRVRILHLPNLPPKGDVSDWIAAGGTREALLALVERAPDASAAQSSTGGTEPPRDSPGELILDPRSPLISARQFLARNFAERGSRTLHHHAGAFYAWTGTCYPPADEAALRARLYAFLDSAVRLTEDGEVVPFNPNRHRVDDVLDALRASANLPASVCAPAWLDHVPDLPADEILACANGLLHLPTRQLVPHTPEFFSLNALDFAFDATAPAPAEWLRFLASIWPGDAESIATLQELFGYMLSTDTRQQKLFLLVGPKRCGKGTIARVLSALLGQNVAGPTLAGLGTNFGLAPLIGKMAAIIGDARLSGKADQQVIAERLLSISGEDAITIDRKHRPAWTGRLRTRFLLISNELPRLSDASGALASRFIILNISQSFYGKEDHGLTDRLLGDLPGILNWALAGWQRLNERGHFVPPAASAEAMRELEDLGSPIGSFLRERCVIDPRRSVPMNHLFNAWCDWCNEQRRDHVGTVTTFARDLRASVPGLTTTQPRDGQGGRYRAYHGVGLQP